MATPQIVTSPQAGLILGCSAQTVVRLMRRGKLTPAMRLDTGPNGAYLFHRADIEKLARDRARARTRAGHPTLDLDVDDVDPDSALQPTA